VEESPMFYKSEFFSKSLFKNVFGNFEMNSKNKCGENNGSTSKKN
jgi:hypothetical protein